MYRSFYVVLTIKAPSDEGKKISFKDKELLKDIFEGVTRFNKEFTSIKQLKIKDIKDQEIHLYLHVYDPNGQAQYTTRDLSFFSKRMYHDLNWSRFSREESKMFTGVKFEEVETIPLEKFNEMSVLPSSIAYLLEKEISEQLMTDEMCQKLLNTLIEIKDFGRQETIAKKKQSIYEIKKILNDLFN